MLLLHTNDIFYLQNHAGHIPTSQQNLHQNCENANSPYRAVFTAQDYYNTQNMGLSTGAVPRSNWHVDSNKSTARPYQEEINTNAQTVVQIEQSREKDSNKNNKSMTKTYHTIKDIISSKFKSSKDNIDEKLEDQPGLNNISEEMKKNCRNSEENGEDTKNAKNSGDHVNYKQRNESNITMQQHQYNQQVIQQHIMAQRALQNHQTAQQYQISQQNRNQPNVYPHQTQLMQARSQEILAPRPEDYYQSAYVSSPQRSTNRYGIQGRDQTYIQMHQPIVKERFLEDKRQLNEQRSAQQLERENMRHITLESRRATSHPQLAYDNENLQVESTEPKPQPLGSQQSARRGSQGNVMDASQGSGNVDGEKDSDDGGFLTRSNMHDQNKTTDEQVAQNGESCKEGRGKLDVGLSGTPRKKLEGEIGKIEGVYNVGQRTKADSEGRKQNAESGTSSDYDKTGQSSSNADSGRGSAAYSSGRRPGGIDISNESSDPNIIVNPSYRDSHYQGS